MPTPVNLELNKEKCNAGDVIGISHRERLAYLSSQDSSLLPCPENIGKSYHIANVQGFLEKEKLKVCESHSRLTQMTLPRRQNLGRRNHAVDQKSSLCFALYQ